jgi:hypothetical protein
MKRGGRERGDRSQKTGVRSQKSGEKRSETEDGRPETGDLGPGTGDRRPEKLREEDRLAFNGLLLSYAVCYRY